MHACSVNAFFSVNFPATPDIFFVIYSGGKIRMFLALLANIRGKSIIFTRKLHVIPTPACATIAYVTRALTGVTNIEFFVFHVTLPSASTAQRR